MQALSVYLDKYITGSTITSAGEARKGKAMRRMRQDHRKRCEREPLHPKAAVASCFAMTLPAYYGTPAQPQSQAMGAARSDPRRGDIPECDANRSCADRPCPGEWCRIRANFGDNREETNGTTAMMICGNGTTIEQDIAVSQRNKQKKEQEHDTEGTDRQPDLSLCIADVETSDGTTVADRAGSGVCATGIAP